MRRLIRATSDDARYVDLAAQIVEVERRDGAIVETGRVSRVYGGRWDRFASRYDVQAPRSIARYRASRAQFEILQAALDGGARHVLIKGARRSGKSEVMAMWVAIRMLTHPGLPIGVVAIKHGKAKKWARRKLLPRISSWLADGKDGYRKSPDDFGFTLINGARVEFLSGYVVDSPRGEGYSAVACDERQLISRELMDSLFLTLSESSSYQTFEVGTALDGEFRDYYESVERDPSYYVGEMSTMTNAMIDTAFVDDAARHMDPRRYAQEVLAQFIAQSGRVYHQYDRATHRAAYADRLATLLARYGSYAGMRDDETPSICRQQFRRDTEWIVGMDFNLAPMVAVVYKVLRGPPLVGEIYWMIDEVVIDDGADAAKMSSALKARGYAGAVVIPDASGAYSEGGRSSHRMLRDDGFAVVAPKRNPPIVDRINAVNSLLRSARGDVRLYIDPRCASVIRCMESYQLDDRGKPAKDGIHEHRSDALGYPLAMLAPAAVDRSREHDAVRNAARRMQP